MIVQYSTRAQRKRRKGVPKGLTDRVLGECRYRCVYCGAVATVADHIVPYSYGGTDAMSNLVGSCDLCNSIAGDRVFDSLSEKIDHVRAKRAARKAGDRETPKCQQCGAAFLQGAAGATKFHCSHCSDGGADFSTPAVYIVVDNKSPSKVKLKRATKKKGANMATGANCRRYRMGAIRGARVRWQSRITPDAIMQAGYKRPATRFDRKALERGGYVPDFTAFCRAIGFTRNLYFQVQNGSKAPTDNFRFRVSKALGVPEDQLFERTIEGEA